MQRRRFVQAVTSASAAAGTLSAQQPPTQAKINTVPAEAAAEPAARLFTPSQFATLRSLSALLQPAANGRPGAIEAGVPEFLDFLIGVSPTPRQTLYRSGLDHLEAESRRLFQKPFSDLAAAQADKVLRPLLVPWTFDPPKDPHQRFLADVRSDVRTATMNSKEMSQVTAASANRRRRGPGGAAPYWLPIDPTR